MDGIPRSPVGRPAFLVPLIWVLVVLTFLLVTLGGVVRNAGAGLSCPDWPLCFGQIVPQMDHRIFLEWLHRLLAGSVGVVFVVVVTTILSRETLRAKAALPAVAGIVLLLIQIVLGGLTVSGMLAPEWVASHLATGMLFFASTIWIGLRVLDSGRSTEGTRNPMLARFSAFALAMVFLQIVLGGVVSSNYAGLACPDFPTCNGAWIPEIKGPVGLQFLHRVGALITLVTLVVLLMKLLPRATRPRARLALYLIPPILSIQLILGVGNVYLAVPWALSIFHLAMAALLFAAAIVVAYEVRHG